MAARKPSYPFASIAVYGPDATRATKMVAAVFTRSSRGDADAMEAWTVDAGDVRNDPVVATHLTAWLTRHGVKNTTMTDRITGCPHQEGIDYPMGRTCPQCPFWANIDRFTHEPIVRPEATMSPDAVLEELSLEHSAPTLDALMSADAHRAALTDPLLEALERGLQRGPDASEAEGQVFCSALYILAKWRETRAYPYVLRWLAQPTDTIELLTGDILTEDGARILAAVADRNLEPIRALVLDRAADEMSRAVGIGALALLAAWKEMDRATIVGELSWLAREGLEREPGYVWSALAYRCADIEALEVFPELRRAFEEGLIDAIDLEASELDAVEAAPRGETLAETRDREPPIDDVAEETAWWSSYGDDDEDDEDASDRWLSDGREPYRAPPKVGRNEPCPCGSGKKYKKCCGA
jgi:hypothetical protein